jgi:DNA-binding IclR family transcriptional regulator
MTTPHDEPYPDLAEALAAGRHGQETDDDILDLDALEAALAQPDAQGAHLDHAHGEADPNSL